MKKLKSTVKKMAQRTYELGFRLGLVGRPIMPTECGDGCPNLWNAQIREGGDGSGSLLGKPGFWRTFMTRLDTLVVSESRDNGKRLVCFHALDAYGVPGTGFAVIDFTRPSATGVRVLALGVNENIDPITLGLAANETVRAVTYAGLPAAALSGGFPKLYQMRAHEYPRVHTIGDRTLVMDQWSQSISVRNGVARRAGLKPPARKPTLRSFADSKIIIDPCDTIDATPPLNATTGWVAATDTGAALTVATTALNGDGNYSFAPFYNPMRADPTGGALDPTPYKYIEAQVNVQGVGLMSVPAFVDAGGPTADGTCVITDVDTNIEGQRFKATFTDATHYTVTGSAVGAVPGGTGLTTGAPHTLDGFFTIEITAGATPFAANDYWVMVSGVIAVRNIGTAFSNVPLVSKLRWSGKGPNGSRMGQGQIYNFTIPVTAQEETWEIECVRITKSTGAAYTAKGSISGVGPEVYEFDVDQGADQQWPAGGAYASVFGRSAEDFANFPQFYAKYWTGNDDGKGWGKIGDKLTFEVLPAVGRVRFGFMLKANDDKPDAILPAGTISLLLATATYLNDDAPVEIPIDINVQAGEWYIMDYPIPVTGTTFYSMGFRVLKPVPGDLFRGNSYTICFDQIEKIVPQRGPFKGPWASLFTWTNPNLPGRPESDPSPPSDFLQCGTTGIAVALDSAGFRGYYGLKAASTPWDIPPEDDARGANYTTEASNYRVYMTQAEFGLGRGSGEFWRLAGPTNGIIPQTPPIQFPGNGSASGSPEAPPAHDGLEDLNPIVIGDGLTGAIADIVLAHDLSDLEGAETLKPYRGQIPATKCSIVDRDRIVMAGQDDYSAGIGVDVRKYYDVAHLRTVGDVVPTGSGLNDITVGGDYTGLTDAVIDVEIDTTAASPDTFKWRIDGGSYTTGVPVTTTWTTLTAGIQVKWAAVDGHTIGRHWAFDAKFARWGPAMVGRRLRVYSTDTDEYPNVLATRAKDYLIEGWIDEFNVIIGNRLQVLTLRNGEHYNGTTGTFDYVIRGEKNKVWVTAKTGADGPDPESAYFEFDVDMPNDEIVGLSLAGEYLMIHGHGGTWRTIQNRGAFDETEDAYPQPEPMSALGVAGPRMVVKLPGGKVFGMSPDWRFFEGNAGAIKFYEGIGTDAKAFPVSSRIKGWLSANAEADAFRHSWMVYDANRNWVVLVMVQDDGDPSATPYSDGAAYDFSLPETDFYYALVVDLTQGIVLPWDKVRLSCPLLVSQGQPDEGTQPSKIFAADMYGYIYEMNLRTARANGVPMNVLRAIVTARTSDYILTFASNTFVDPDGNDLTGDRLKDLWATIVGATTVTRRISSSTANTLTFYTADGILPADALGSVVHLGQINVEADTREVQLDYHGWLQWMKFKTYRGATSLPTQIQVNVFANADRNRFVDRSAAATYRILTDDDFEEGDGKVYFEKIPARAIQVQLGWSVQESDGAVQDDQEIGDTEIQGIAAALDVANTETFVGGL